MPHSLFHSILLVEEKAFTFFKWPLRWFANAFPSLKVRLITDIDSLERSCKLKNPFHSRSRIFFRFSSFRV